MPSAGKDLIMKSLTKVFFLVSLIMVMVLSSCSFNAIADTDAEVANEASLTAIENSMVSSGTALQLANASTRVINLGSAVAIGVLDGEIELENIAYHKDVVIRYTVDGVNWQDKNAYYKESLADNREIWGFSVTLGETSYNSGNYSGYNCEFAVKYTVNNQTYWDNNGGYGINYKISSEGVGAIYPTTIN